MPLGESTESGAEAGGAAATSHAAPPAAGGASSEVDATTSLTPIGPAALRAALEAIPSAAFVVRLPDTILRANSRGRALLADDPERVLAALRGSAPPPRGPVRFPIDSTPDHAILVLHDLEGDARTRLGAMTRHWGLTPRQSAVLALVAQGESNRTVAARLGCSEKTVELHVSALLAKTRCASRSQLVASFWTEPG